MELEIPDLAAFDWTKSGAGHQEGTNVLIRHCTIGRWDVGECWNGSLEPII